MKTKYSFSILRYVHDPVSQEFVNIGVAVYSPQASYLKAVCTSNYSRISNLFQKIDGHGFRQISRYVQDQISSSKFARSIDLPFEDDKTIQRILAKVLPPDDSSIQFSGAGFGLSEDLDKTLNDLYLRYVEKYSVISEVVSRTDEEVWRVFRTPLDRARVTSRLFPKKIVAASYDYEFQRSWKNEIWHVLEPVSFDMVEPTSLLEKANRWVGRAMSLMDSSEPFRIHMLLGEPTDSRVREAFIKAQNILNKMPVKKEFVRESEADSFAQEIARELENHP